MVTPPLKRFLSNIKLIIDQMIGKNPQDPARDPDLEIGILEGHNLLNFGNSERIRDPDSPTVLTKNISNWLVEFEGPAWVPTILFNAESTDTTGGTKLAPEMQLNRSGTLLPHTFASFADIKDKWGLVNVDFPGVITVYNDIKYWYGAAYNFMSRPIWVPPGINFRCGIKNLSATLDMLGWAVVWKITW